MRILSISLLVLPIFVVLAPRGYAEPVRTTVYWSDTGGARGRAEFEGVVADGVLTGQVLFGGERLVVLGTVDEEGVADGVIESPGAGQVGTFETSLVGGELSGEFTITESSGGLWTTDTPGPTQRIPDVNE